MCVAEGLDESHTCSGECPVCYRFTLGNITRLCKGEKIELGVVDEFIELAEAGCLLCALLVACWNTEQQVHS